MESLTPETDSREFEAHLRDGDAYAVKLSVFEGPLDLLLHLIRMNEVEITEIPISRIANQYLEYLELMREVDIDVAAEYLVMAATLAWIKSRMLLPPDPTDDEEEGGDPRAELVARLLEYERFKEVAGDLGERVRLGRDVFPAATPETERPNDEEREIEVGLLDLLEAFRSVLNASRGPAAAHELEAEPISVRDRMVAIMEALEGLESLEFSEIFRDEDGSFGSRTMIVATFLAMLELARWQTVRLFQSLAESGAPYGPIRLRPSEEVGVHWKQKIAENM
jgi:segregation and condensation protein A